MSDKKDDKSRWEVGAEYFEKNYGGMLKAPPQGQDDFFDVMLESLFAGVWSRDEVLCLRDRRLFTMGIIAAMGEPGVFEIQCGCALRREEMSVEQIRELCIHLAPYAGYPRAGSMKAAAEKAIAAYQKSLNS